MESTLHQINSFAHIGFGSLALLGGLIAFISLKGSPTHIRGGKLFAWMMLLVVVTTLLAMFFEFLPLAIVMCLAEAYLIPSALLSVNRQVTHFKAFSIVLALLLALLFLFTAVQFVRFNLISDELFLGPAVLATLFGFLLVQDIGMLRRRDGRHNNYWIRRHLLRMIMAFTFAVMALVRIGIDFGLTLEQSVIYPLVAAAIVTFLVLRRFPDGAEVKAERPV